jgi:hypothetical protein
MAIDKKLIDQLLTDYKKPEDIIGEDGLLKELRSQEGLQGLFLRPSCGPFPVNRFQEVIVVALVAIT